MPSVCFYFQVHQPFRVKKYKYFDIGKDHDYFNSGGDNDLNNERILKKVARKSYLPTNKILLELLKKHSEFKVTFSFSGVALEQMERYSPKTIESFKKLVDTGQVEVLSETYYHSLSFIYSEKEFERQVDLHKKTIKRIFNYQPTNFRCTELSYNNDLAKKVADMGYKGILAEGVDNILGWRSPNFLYQPKDTDITLFLKNYKLSDDIAFRFSSKKWKEYPLTADKFAEWVSAVNGNGEIINLFMDYETFGEHQWKSTGIFEFLKKLPEEVLRNPDNDFVTIEEANERYSRFAELDIPHFTSWADTERDLSAWIGNPMQRDLLNKLYGLEEDVIASANQDLIEDWRRLQTSDHFYYISTKGLEDGTVHNYFSPYESPYEAYISFVNAFNDFKYRLEEKSKIKIKK
jgi:alpha-amylase